MCVGSHALILALKPVEDHEWFLQVIPNTLQHSSDSTAVSKSCIKYCARSMCKSSWASAPNINAFNASVHHLWPMGQWGSVRSYHPITPPDSTGLKRHLCNLLLRSLCMDCFCDGFGLTKTELGGSAFNGCLWLMYCWLAISVHFLCGLLFFPEHLRNCVHPAKHSRVIAHDSWWSSHFSWLLNSFSINVVQRPLHPLHHELRCRADHSKWSFLPSRAFLFTRDAGTRLEVQLVLVASSLFEHGKGWPDSIVALTWLYRLGVGAVLLAAGLILLAGALARGWLLAVSMTLWWGFASLALKEAISGRGPFLP